MFFLFGSDILKCNCVSWFICLRNLNDVLYVVKESFNTQNMMKVSSLEQVLTLIVPHVGEKPCVCQTADHWCSFSSQILTIPFFWQMFPRLKEVGLLKVFLSSRDKFDFILGKVILIAIDLPYLLLGKYLEELLVSYYESFSTT